MGVDYHLVEVGDGFLDEETLLAQETPFFYFLHYFVEIQEMLVDSLFNLLSEKPPRQRKVPELVVHNPPQERLQNLPWVWALE